MTTSRANNRLSLVITPELSRLQLLPGAGLPDLGPVKPTTVYNTYWYFAAERQNVFFRRLSGDPPPCTQDSIIAAYRFTNAFRASDRVSQFLIREVIYKGNQTIDEVFFRILLFKLFNKIETWELLQREVRPLSYSGYCFEEYDRVLTAEHARGRPLYSAAYIMPACSHIYGYKKKHQNHLRLLERMMEDKLPHQLAHTSTMREGFELLRTYPMIGDFLAYQFITDINYSELVDYSEMEFVAPGPGARDGIRKCFSDLGSVSEAGVIRMMADRQEQEFARLGLTFRNIWGRRLQLIDCQNLFCEVGKYARIKHPEIRGISGRTRIKQRYRENAKPLKSWYPPKWRLNEKIPEEEEKCQ